MRQLLSLFIVLSISLICVVSNIPSSFAQAKNEQAQAQPELEEVDADSSGVKKEESQKTAVSKASPTLKVTRMPKSEASQEEVGSDIYLKQIQRIESQVNELKEEIFRSRTRLAILKESVLASGLSGTELKIIHRNEMGANFKLERMLYVLDGSPIKQAQDIDGELDRQETIEILNGTIPPGNHQLEVELVYRGNGFGVFSYLQSYRFTLNDVTTFQVKEGNRTIISAVGYERSGLTLELKDRPDIRFDRSDEKLDLDEEAKEKKNANESPDSDSSESAP